jgi:hypothetical protein
MIKKAKSAVSQKGIQNVEFTLLDKCILPRNDDHYDFIYAFDVFPHCGMICFVKFSFSLI